MGISIQGLNFLRFARRKQAFGRVATIGRQELSVPKDKLKILFNLNKYTKHRIYCEELLIRHFAATAVESFDNSDFENATHITDMNKPLAVQNRYDTVIDFGCLEHIYNIPQALMNVSELCSVDGQILHVSPANNFCGHGFWQFSPELFFTLYSEPNGYKETEVFLADGQNEQFWYQVREPRGGMRANVTSSNPTFVLVRTRKTKVFSHENVHQSDYAFTWKRNEIASLNMSKFKNLVKRSALGPFARTVNSKWKGDVPPTPTALSSENPHLIKVAVSSLV